MMTTNYSLPLQFADIVTFAPKYFFRMLNCKQNPLIHLANPSFNRTVRC